MISVKIMSIMTAGALFLGSMTTSAFAWDQISGNGAVSTNTITSSQRNTATVNQTNNANFNNNVSVSGSTGGNRASFNTGGHTSITTGSTGATVDISNVAGQNIANLGGLSGSMVTTHDAAISGNGAFSHNRISENVRNSLQTRQNNYTSVYNRVNTSGKSGYNSSSYNTGGNSSIHTGGAYADVTLYNMAGSNQLGL